MTDLDRQHRATAASSITQALGHHVCVVTHGRAARDGYLTDWAHEGLAGGERVVLVGGADLLPDEPGAELRAALDRGAVHLVDPADAYARGTTFRMELAARARVDGYTGARIAADMAGALAHLDGTDDLWRHEAATEARCAGGDLSSLCLYDRTRFGHELAAAARAHPRALVDEQVVVAVEATRVRISGEVDVANADLVGAVLGQVASTSEKFVVDLAGVTFIDVAGAGHVVALARRLAPTRLQVLRPSRQFRLIAEAMGWDGEVELVVEAP